VDDLDSEASRDKYFKSSFANEPIKVWSGEVGVAILGNHILSNFSKELENVAEDTLS
jgi:hypothetical protein